MDRKIYDENHRRSGSVSKDLLGNDVIRDANGKVTGYLGEDVLGNKVIRDANGRVQGVFGQDMLGNDVIRNTKGQVEVRMGKDAFGNNAVYDAYGRKTGYFEGAGSSKTVPDDEDDNPYYNRALGRNVYPRDPRELELASACGRWTAPAYISYILPALYAAVAIFWGKLPASPALIIGVLTAGIFLSSLFGRAGQLFTFRSHAATFFISLFLCYVWFMVWTTYRVEWHATEKQEVTVLLAGPALFLIAELIGGLIGLIVYSRTRKRIFR